MATILQAFYAGIMQFFLGWEGELNAEIIETAEKHDVNHIYMGKHKQPAYKRVLMGDTAESVIQYSRIPVFLIDNGKTAKANA